MGDQYGGVTLIFLMLIVTGSMVNFDSGGTAAVLVLLGRGCPQEVLEARGQNTTHHVQDPAYPCLSESDKGILGAAPYIGLCFGCPLAGELVRRISEKKVLLVSLALNVVATFIFAYVLDKYYLWTAKFLVGLTQSAISVYAPVWVSKFAPAAYKTLWYGLMQSSTAIGCLFGYAVCGYLVDLGVFYQRAFQIQAFWLLATCILLVPIPSRWLNVSAHAAEVMHTPLCDDSAESVESGLAKGGGKLSPKDLVVAVDDRGPSSALAQLLELFRRPIFVATVMANCGLYFTVSAVQYWASHFFIAEFRRPGAEVTTLFVLVAGSAPFLGCFMGSAIVDRSGGYETPQKLPNALALTTSWAMAASVAGVIAGAVDPHPDMPDADLRFYGVVGCVWVLLFFGGAMLPAVTGISMAAVPEGLRKSASSWSMLLYNVFGFSLGTYLPGHIGEQTSIRVAMQIVFLWALLSSFALVWAYTVASRLARRDHEGKEFPCDVIEGTDDSSIVSEETRMTPADESNIEMAGNLRSRAA